MDGNIGHISGQRVQPRCRRDVNAALVRLRAEAGGRAGWPGWCSTCAQSGRLARRGGGAVGPVPRPKGQIVSSAAATGSDTIYYDAETVYRGDMAAGVPMIVLIDAGSASASEIVAGALQDQRRALVMGERSFGKGSVQSLLPLDPRFALKLTTARYYTPAGRGAGRRDRARHPRAAAVRSRCANGASAMPCAKATCAATWSTSSGSRTRRWSGPIDDPRFTLTAAQLEEQGIEDFQLHYALETLRRTGRMTIAARAGTGTSRN
jgi:carboxyl-terminal processing protease